MTLDIQARKEKRKEKWNEKKNRASYRKDGKDREERKEGIIDLDIFTLLYNFKHTFCMYFSAFPKLFSYNYSTFPHNSEFNIMNSILELNKEIQIVYVECLRSHRELETQKHLETFQKQFVVSIVV